MSWFSYNRVNSCMVLGKLTISRSSLQLYLLFSCLSVGNCSFFRNQMYLYVHHFTFRYILIDWLFEVLEMKEFPSSTIHLAVNMVDSYLQQRPVPRSRLQLLGISAMLLAARWMGTQIITIREAAWLTDNTYKYEEVVQMMGELFAVFRGNIRVS